MTTLLLLTSFLAQETVDQAQKAPGPIFWTFEIAFIVLMVAALWKIFSKAGQPGWAAIIPIFNTYILCKVAGRPGWWFILLLIPFVNFIIYIILCLDLAKRFGKGGGFGIGLLLLPFIFFPILGFGSAQYQGAPPPAASLPATA